MPNELTPAQRRMGMVDPEEQKLLAARQIIAPPPARNSRVFTPAELERMARIGQLGMLTGDRALAPMGEMNLKRAQALHELELDREQKQAVRDEQARSLAAYERNWERGDAFRREELAANLSEAEKERALRRELKRLGLDGTGTSGPKLTAGQQGQAAELATALTDVQAMREKLKGSPNVASKPRKLFVEGMEMIAPEKMEGTVGQWAKEQVYTPEDRQLMRDFSEQLAARIKAVSGAAASDKERAFLESIMPRAGMSMEDLDSAAARLEDYLTSRASAAADPMGTIRGGGNRGPQEGDVVDGYRFLGGDPNDPNAWEEE